MNKVQVNLGTRSYPIYIGSNLLSTATVFEPHITGSQVFVVSNKTVAEIYLETLSSTLASIGQVNHQLIPDGEVYKNLSTVEAIFDRMLTIPCDRNTTVVALGGGVVGDVTGFVAACYQRGVPYIHVPTTLLGQVDSAIGGKTGVNHPLGKNMIGAIYQPKCVVADIDTLSTLPEREYLAGMAEIIKYGLIRDADFFDWIDENVDPLMQRDVDSLAFAIERSCLNKAQVVELDERESGIRAILNFGHTFGHAIESFMRYKDWLHGEAVATGMIMGADFSNRLGLLDDQSVHRIERIIQRFKLPTVPPKSMKPNNFLQAMAVDKKVDARTIRFIVLEGIGQATVLSQYPMSSLEETLSAVTNSSNV